MGNSDLFLNYQTATLSIVNRPAVSLLRIILTALPFFNPKNLVTGSETRIFGNWDSFTVLNYFIFKFFLLNNFTNEKNNL